jgi:hypothetical protein
MWRLEAPGKPSRTFASLTVARPRSGGYVIKELIPALETPPKAALDKAVAVAKRGDVVDIFVNADLGRLPTVGRAAAG